jgi:hypothetical protein
MPKITKSERNKDREVIQAKTKDKSNVATAYKWWQGDSKKQRAEQLITTASFLKEQQQYRYRQASIYARLYGNHPISNFIGSNFKMGSGTGLGPQNLPVDRPTMNVVQSCIDTLVSRITQNRPRPIFLTDNGNYKERNLAKHLNGFIQGELYQTKAYALGETLLRDAAVLGTGVIKIFEKDKRVALERKLITELLLDPNDSLYGNPRQLMEVALIDRSVLMDIFPEYRATIEKAEQAYPDNSGEASRTVSDQVMIVEGWHLPSGKDASDGKHIIACTAGCILDEGYNKQKFPFIFLPYSSRILGFEGQGLAEQLMGTQVEINKLLMTISTSINLVGVPRVFVEDGSKVVKAHLNNAIGSIVTYRGTKPQYEVAPCVPAELYQQLQRLIGYAYQQSGISELAASSKKPAGLTSGTALREYDDLQSDRFAALNRRYDNVFIDLAYAITDLAKDIAERDGSYTTVYPNKDGTKEVDLPKAEMLKDPVIQCYDSSALPKDPAGRKQQITEDMQAGLISPQEGRRLLQYPDLEQEDTLANAGEERILKILDEIVDTGKYTPPDPFMNFDLATQKAVEYYNLYTAAKLEESKAQKLRDFFTQVQALKQAAQPPPMPGQMPGAPAAGTPAVPEAPPTSDLLPMGPAS